MRLDISASAGLRRQAVLPAIETTREQARSLYRIYARAVAMWEDAARATILPVYAASLSALTRDDATSLEIAIDRTDNGVLQAVATGWRKLFEEWAADISLTHMRKFAGNLKYATDIDVGTLLSAIEGPETVQAALIRNTSLIRSVSDQVRQAVADIVMRGIQQRTPVRDVAREIAKVTGLARARALRIASDQTVKLSAALDRQRMIDVGIEEFEWRHSRKAHPREWHKARNGKRFRFDDPKLRGDLPGDQPFCGCKAKGVIGPATDASAPVRVPAPRLPRKPRAPSPAPPPRRPRPAIAPPPETPAQRNARTDAELRTYVVETGRATGHEYLDGYDAVTGYRFARTTSGLAGKVLFTPEITAAISDPARKVVLHHNHPSSNSFSNEDIQALWHFKGMQGVWAHGHNGSSYYAERGTKAVSLLSLKRAESDAVDALRKIALATTDYDGVDAVYHHTKMLILAQRGIISYNAQLADRSEAAWSRLGAAIVKGIARYV